MNERGKSDGFVVPQTPANNIGTQVNVSSHQAESIAEQVEERKLAKGNLVRCTKGRAQTRETLQAALDRIRQAAGRDRDLRILHPYPEQRLAVKTQSRSPVR